MPTVTLSQLQNSVLDRLDGNSLFFTTPELTSAINENIRVANLLTGFLQGNKTVTTVSNQLWYLVPCGILYPLRVQLGGYYLQKTGLNAIGSRDPYWETKTTSSSVSIPTEWIPRGLAAFALYPSDSVAGQTITITGVLEPKLLASGTDPLVMPIGYSDLIVDMSVHILMLKDSTRVFQSSMDLYKRSISRLRKLGQLVTDQQPYYRPEVEHAGVMTH